MLATDVASYLPGDLLVKVDIATMANSLEGRSPLLDHHVMEFAASLPSAWKIHGGTTKYLLKKAARGWLPDEVLDRPKRGFGVPIASWLRTELRDMSWDLLTDATAIRRGYFAPVEVRRLLTEHAQGRDHSPRLWALLQLELWHRTWLDREPTARPPLDEARLP
jgi:asparagine synthase (glutamine-hydrolysing)